MKLPACWPLPRGARRRRVLGILALLPAALLLALLAASVRGRLGFPLALEWLEGSQIYHAQRLLGGLPLYHHQPAGFLPHPYPPLHPVVLAAAGAIFGLDYLTARAVSLLALLLSAALLLRELHRCWPRGPARPALLLVTAGYFAATYSMVQAWYDIARVDSLALCLVLLAGAPLARERLSWPGVLLSALFASLALYTKQTTVFFAAGLCLLAFWRNRRKGLVLAGLIGGLCLAALIALQQRSDGAFVPWLLNTRHHVFEPLRLLSGPLHLVKFAPFVLLLPVLAWPRAGRPPLSPRSALWLGLLLCALPAGLLPYAKRGGAENSLIPFLFLAGPVTLMLLGERVRGLQAQRRGQAIAAILLVQALYLPFFLFAPGRANPGPERLALARQLTAEISALRGGVIAPFAPMLPSLCDQRTPQASWVSHADAMAGGMAGVTAQSYGRWLLHQDPRWLLLPDELYEDGEALRRQIEGRFRFVKNLPAPHWEGLWLRNPISHRLYQRIPAR